ncbi:hypothetical protein ACQKM9_21410 [Viridibacillus sp. NPDC093762]|uniref:hypothetical protein n=1 Tax=Viridibacillus sp. NPDC093762 TaxID=3390720 RepID=UPI003D0440A0
MESSAVWNLFDLANQLDIDLEEAFRKKSEINIGLKKDSKNKKRSYYLGNYYKV